MKLSLYAIRKAAAVSDAIMETALSVAKVGISEQAIAAEVHRRMFEIGGEYVGFGPFIRSGERLPYEHEVWTGRVIGKGEQLFVEMAGCVGRYHAPMGRLAFAGKAPEGTQEIAQICIAAQDRVLAAMRPGATGADVYNAWQTVIDEAGLTHYRRQSLRLRRRYRIPSDMDRWNRRGQHASRERYDPGTQYGFPPVVVVARVWPRRLLRSGHGVGGRRRRQTPNHDVTRCCRILMPRRYTLQSLEI
ncbi:M24 family metallopeptidase [Mesorhizobium sp. M0598]|uniref:M24 family metallopeptidase n=1 Tax=Mesorhizobium sp. M0598 TaxID=2956968 RepID=UPI003338D0A3